MAKLQEKIELKALISGYCSEKGISKADFAAELYQPSHHRL